MCNSQQIDCEEVFLILFSLFLGESEDDEAANQEGEVEKRVSANHIKPAEWLF